MNFAYIGIASLRDRRAISETSFRRRTIVPNSIPAAGAVHPSPRFRAEPSELDDDGYLSRRLERPKQPIPVLEHHDAARVAAGGRPVQIESPDLLDEHGTAAMSMIGQPAGRAARTDAIETLGVFSRIVVDLECGVRGSRQPMSERPGRAARAKLLHLFPGRDGAGPGGAAPCLQVHAGLISQSCQPDRLASQDA